MNSLQNRLLDESREIVDLVEPIAPASSWFAENIEKHVIPLIENIEDKHELKEDHHKEWYSSRSIREKTRKVKSANRNIEEYYTTAELSYYVIKYLNILMWIPIIMSFLWLYQDLYKYKLVTSLCFIVAVAANYISYQFLQSIWPL